jgi:hypothetical protein
VSYIVTIGQLTATRWPAIVRIHAMVAHRDQAVQEVLWLFFVGPLLLLHRPHFAGKTMACLSQPCTRRVQAHWSARDAAPRSHLYHAQIKFAGTAGAAGLIALAQNPIETAAAMVNASPRRGIR